jgi:iron complex outermembrane receptor protein
MRLLKSSLLGTSAALCLAASATAQTGGGVDSAAATRLEELVVTAQKREQAINDVPMSITAISGEVLADRGVVSSADLTKLVPGFSYSEAAFATPIYTIRGIGFNESTLAARSTVAIYVDEVPIPFPIETRATGLDLQRVEVLKGPQGTLFGQNATGGAINFITAKPTDTLRAGVDASYGRFNEIDLSGFVSGPLAEGVKARLAVRRLQSDDWQKSQTRAATMGKVDQTMGRLLLDFDPSDRLHIGLNINGYIDRSDVPAAQYVAFAPLVPTLAGDVVRIANSPVAPRSNRVADWDPGRDFARDNWFVQVAGRVDYHLTPDILLTSISAYSRYHNDHVQDVDGTAQPNIVFKDRGDIESVNQELRVTATLADRATLILGANYEDHRVNETQDGLQAYGSSNRRFTVLLGAPPYYSYQNLSRQDSEATAVFGNLDFDVTDQVTLHAGGRYTDYSTRFSGCTADGADPVVGPGIGVAIGPLFNALRAGRGLGPITFIPGVGKCVTGDINLVPGRVESKLSEDNFSWRLGADFKPVDGTLLYANVSKGYKNGSYPTLAGSSIVQFQPVVQEEVTAYEAGIKVQLLDRSVQFNGAVYHYDYRDKQMRGRLIDPVFGALEALVNVPKSRVNGAEVQITAAPIKGLMLNLGASYVDSKVLGSFLNFTPLGVQQQFGGEPFPLTPKWQVIGGAAYEWPVGEALKAFVNLDATYQSHTNGSFGRPAVLDIESYTTVDGRIGVKSEDDRWRASLWVRNLFDAYYYTNAARGLDTIYRQPGRPRMFGVAVTYRYE